MPVADVERERGRAKACDQQMRRVLERFAAIANDSKVVATLSAFRQQVMSPTILARPPSLSKLVVMPLTLRVARSRARLSRIFLS